MHLTHVRTTETTLYVYRCALTMALGAAQERELCRENSGAASEMPAPNSCAMCSDE